MTKPPLGPQFCPLGTPGRQAQPFNGRGTETPPEGCFEHRTERRCERSLSEEFFSCSPDTQHAIRFYTSGGTPTTNTNQANTNPPKPDYVNLPLDIQQLLTQYGVIDCRTFETIMQKTNNNIEPIMNQQPSAIDSMKSKVSAFVSTIYPAGEKTMNAHMS